MVRLLRKPAIGAAAILAAYLLFWPVPIDPVPWHPPPSPGLEVDGHLYLGSLTMPAVGRVRIPTNAATTAAVEPPLPQRSKGTKP